MNNLTGMSDYTYLHFVHVQKEMEKYIQQGSGGYLHGVNGQFQQHQQLPIAAYRSNIGYMGNQPNRRGFIPRFIGHLLS